MDRWGYGNYGFGFCFKGVVNGELDCEDGIVVVVVDVVGVIVEGVYVVYYCGGSIDELVSGWGVE